MTKLDKGPKKCGRIFSTSHSHRLWCLTTHSDSYEMLCSHKHKSGNSYVRFSWISADSCGKHNLCISWTWNVNTSSMINLKPNREAVNDNEETLTLSGGLVSPALWPARIWSCTELWSSSGLPAGPLPRAGSARSPGHPIHQKTTDNKHDTKAAISSAKIKLTTNNKSKAVSVLSS